MYEEVKGRPLYLVAEELGLERHARTGAGSGADTVAGGERSA
jgi:hypothetical protein